MFGSKLGIRKGIKVLKNNLPAQIISLFCENGFDINETLDDAGNTLLHYACGSRHNFGEGESSIKFLAAEEAIRQGADIDAKNYLGQTPLMQACTQAYKIAEPILQALLDEGAETDSKDGSGNTALHFAARNKINSDAFAIAEILFDNANPDVSAVNNDGKTALDYATEANNTSLVKLLLSNM